MKKHGVLILTLLMIILSFGYNGWQKSERKMKDIDEAAWVFSSYYWQLVLNKDWENEDWKGFDAIDHPPMAKYLFGMALKPFDLVPQSIELKEYWRSNDLNIPNFFPFLKSLQERTSTEALKVGRWVSTVFFALSALMVFILGRYFFSQAVGFMATALFCTNKLVNQLAMNVVSDGILLFFILVGVALQVVWVNRYRDNKNVLGICIGLSVVSALAYLTKINGLGVLGLSALTILYYGLSCPYKKFPQKVLSVFFNLLIMTSVCALLVYALNPSLWGDFLNFQQSMFLHRLERVGVQMNAFYWFALPSFSLQVSYFIKRLLFDHDIFYGATHLPLFLSGFVLGCVRFYTEDVISQKRRVFYVNALAWCGAVLFTYKLNWDRYLLPVLPFVMLVVGFGLESIILKLRVLGHTTQERLVALLIVLLAMTGFSYYKNYFTGERFKNENPRWYWKAESAQKKILLEYYPTSVRLHEEWRDLQQKLGNDAEVLRINQTISELKEKGAVVQPLDSSKN